MYATLSVIYLVLDGVTDIMIKGHLWLTTPFYTNCYDN